MRFVYVLVFCTIFCYSQQPRNTMNGSNDSVLLQGFHWHSHQNKSWWNEVAKNAQKIADAGFDIVWLPPSSASASKEGYLPHQLYVLDSNYGTKKELQNAISTLHAKKIKVIADIVINHRVGLKNWADFVNPKWDSDAVCKNDEWPHATGNFDTGDGFHAGRDVDHTQEFVQQSIKKWLNWLKSVGYDGWRYDYSKGYKGSYAGMYNDASSPYFSVGEYWDTLDLNDINAHRQRLCNWIDDAKGKSSAFDFTTKGVLQQAVAHNEYWRLRDANGKPSGLIGWWSEKAVTFVDNHDTGPSPGGGQNHWPFPSDKVMLGYAYILTHPGVPTVYWVHFFDWKLGDAISKLIKIRKSQNLDSNSKVEIKIADNSKYAAVVDNKLAVKIGSGDWSPGNGWNLAISGKNYVLWTK